MKAAYSVCVSVMVAMGVLLLALQNCRQRFWIQNKHILSLLFSAAGVCLFAIGRQPYAAVFAFVFSIIKAFILIKRR